MKPIRLLIALLFLGPVAANAALIITDVTFAPGQLSLRVAGTVGAGELSTNDLDSFFFGFDNGGDSSWISNVDGVASSALDVKNGGTYTVSTSSTNAVNGFNAYGGYLYTNSSSLITVGTTIDYNLTWIGNFNFTGLSTNDIVGQIGHNFPLIPLIGGSEVLFRVASVPEPGTLALLGIGLFGMGLARRRKA